MPPKRSWPSRRRCSTRLYSIANKQPKRFGEQCLSIDSSLREAVNQAVPLSEYAWKFRYPGDPYEPTPEEVVEALSTARRVVETVLNRAPADLRP